MVYSIFNIIFAKSSIYACMAWFTNFNIFKAIRKKLDDGVKVVLLTNNDLINNGGYCLDFNALIKKGLELHLAEYPELIHHKFCVLDDQIVMTGSYNWTFFSENINRENMILIKDDNDTIVDNYEYYNSSIESVFVEKTKQYLHIVRKFRHLDNVKVILPFPDEDVSLA